MTSGFPPIGQGWSPPSLSRPTSGPSIFGGSSLRGFCIVAINRRGGGRRISRDRRLIAVAFIAALLTTPPFHARGSAPYIPPTRRLKCSTLSVSSCPARSGIRVSLPSLSSRCWITVANHASLLGHRWVRRFTMGNPKARSHLAPSIRMRFLRGTCHSVGTAMSPHLADFRYHSARNYPRLKFPKCQETCLDISPTNFKHPSNPQGWVGNSDSLFMAVASCRKY